MWAIAGLRVWVWVSVSPNETMSKGESEWNYE